MKTQIQQMVEAGRKCSSECPHRRAGGQVYDDMPISALDKDGKPTTKRAKMLAAAWDVGFFGGDVPVGSRIQTSYHGAGKRSVQVFAKNGELLHDFNV